MTTTDLLGGEKHSPGFLSSALSACSLGQKEAPGQALPVLRRQRGDGAGEGPGTECTEHAQKHTACQCHPLCVEIGK